ncbi:MAG TPA: hypothetical protein VNZ45_07005, partial [Bacteroidia bacterium]|nr:hypothetical protein [Bacteroidia bacterium]
ASVNSTSWGVGALNPSNTGGANTAIGSAALLDNTTGASNVATGFAALRNNLNGGGNTADGTDALSGNLGGSGNVAVGSVSLRTNTMGSNNTAIGVGADVSSGTLNNATAIGAGAIAGENNSVILGTSTTNVGIGTSTPKNKLEIQSQTPGTSGLRLTTLTNVTTPLIPVTQVLSLDPTTKDVILVNTPAGPTTGNFWNLTGNLGTTPGTGPFQNYIGTINPVGFQIGTAGQPRVFVSSAGNVGINTTTPAEFLDVNGNVNVVGNERIGNNVFDGTRLMVSDANRTLGSLVQPTSVELLSSVGGVNNLLHMDNNQTTGRGGCLLSNSASGQWTDNILELLNNGSAFANNFYLTNIPGKTTDAGWSYLGAQGASVKGLGVLTYGTEPVVLGTNNTARLTVAGNGNVGIGTSTPQNNVEIVGSTVGNSGLRLTNLTLTTPATPATQVLSLDPTTKDVILVPAPSGGTIPTDPANGFFWTLIGNSNTTPGTLSGQNFMGTTDDQDVVFARQGVQAGLLQKGNDLGGPGNTAWGVGALLNNSGGGGANVATGYQALQSNSGAGNIATGYEALQNNSGGGANVASGYQALQNNLGGSNNEAIGYQTLQNNQSGNE